MSLSSHIADPTSVLSRLLAVEFPDLGAWRADLRARVPRGRTPVSWPEGSRPPYSTIGHAIDSRLRLALTDTAMHCCLEGAFARHVTDAMLISGLRYPLPPDIEALVATGHGASLPIVAPPVEAGRRLVGQALVKVLLDAATLCRRAEPWKREGLLLNDSDEDSLCRALFVGAWLEESGRSGRLPPESTLAKLIGVASSTDGHRTELVVEQLQQQARGAVPDAVLSDMRMLLELAADSGWGDLRRRTPIVTGPTFSGGHLVGAADGDVIAAGLLVDIKTTVEPSRAKPDDLKQLLGYLLLDTEDAYCLHGVGLYFSRQGLLISWGVEELFQLLGVLKPVDQLRSEFAALSRQSKAAKRERSRADSAQNE